MSKLDFELTEKVLLDLNKMKKTLIEVKDNAFDQTSKDKSKQIDSDPQDWLDIFEEDQVVMYGCR